MDKIEYGKVYLLDYSEKGKYTSQAVYLGKKSRNKRFILNNHVFMVWHNFMKKGDSPVVLNCSGFEIKEEDKLNLDYSAGRKNFARLSKLEKEYIQDLAKKYWDKIYKLTFSNKYIYF